jgi:hypothetical protein
VNRFVEILAIYEEIPAKLLVRLRKRAVGDHGFVVPDADRRRAGAGATPLLEISTPDADISCLNSAQVFAAAWNSSFEYFESIDSSAYINNKYFMSLVSCRKW